MKDVSGHTLISHTSAKAFNHIAIGLEALTANETYTIYLDETIYQSFTISEITTTIGGNMNQTEMMPPGGERRDFRR